MPTATETQRRLNLRPLGDRVIAERIGSVEKSRSGLYLPDTAQEKPQEGKVLAVGTGRILETGKALPLLLRSTEAFPRQIPQWLESARLAFPAVTQRIGEMVFA